ncbi:uncharacterized protein YeaO (DUF488 family) [Mycoplana dimorpha]|uniref:Uncharacterized protein YeaO (DUF488 family) n=1 Tax=Mycoplana dimorpha TaxID=28320 RepID=A0A2T5B1F0_MYCDI|nr:DUF488 domain-containing protein [Mycoplana dimorpha]PTM92775.1 uncharacterized protein YeaO (DUF488 family) [Mycoplana dimorpha]
MTIRLKRVYETDRDGDGTRVLVDRLWPRGLAKEKAGIDLWLKDIAPSDDLRKRFHARPELWDEFRAAYATELEREPAQTALVELRGLLKHGPVTLLYAARDEERNNAVALKEWLEREAP